MGIGATGWAGTLLGAVMILLGSIFAIPAVFIKCKACMITFIPLCIIFCVIGGIIVGFMGFVGAVGGAICDAFLGKESEFYTCSQSKLAASFFPAALATPAMPVGPRQAVPGAGPQGEVQPSASVPFPAVVAASPRSLLLQRALLQTRNLPASHAPARVGTRY